MANDEILDEEESSSGMSIDFKKLALRIVRNLHWVVLLGILGFVAAKIYLRYQIPVYAISSNILVNSELEANTITITGEKQGADASVENEVFILRSQSLLKKVIDSLDLYIELTQDARIREKPLDVQAQPFRIKVIRKDKAAANLANKLTIFNDKFVIAHGSSKITGSYDKPLVFGSDTLTIYKLGDLSSKSGSAYNFSILPEDNVVGKYAQRLTVTISKKGKGILQLNLNDEIPSRAERFVNVLVREYDRTTIFFKNKSTRSALDFLNERLEFVGEELETQENRERDYRSANKLYDISAAAESVITQLDNLDAQKNTAEYNSMLLNVLENHVKNTEQKELFPNSIGIPDVVLGGLVNNYNELLLKKRMVLDLGTPNDPNLPAINGQLKEVRANILKNITNIRAQFQVNKEYLSNLDAAYSGKLKSLPGKERELIRIKRELAIKETLYTFLLQKKEETAIQLMSSDVAGSRTVDAPKNTGVISPQSSNIYSMFIGLGLLIPIGIVALKTLSNQRVETRKDIEGATAIPIVGEVMQIDIDETRPILTSASSKKLMTEQFRILRSNLSYMGLSSGKQVILVTSAISGEGKSFIALNLANIMAQAGKRVVVLEFDLRKPKLSDRLGMANNSGLSEFIASDIHPSKVIKSLDEYPNLYLINSGPVPPNPAELILSNRVSELMEYLKANFDYVIVDTAPVGIVSDTLGLAGFADISLYIVRYNFTVKPTLAYLNKLAKEQKLKNTAIVVYGANKDSSQYGYGYSYGYGNGYYDEDSDRKKRWRIGKSKGNS